MPEAVLQFPEDDDPQRRVQLDRLQRLKRALAEASRLTESILSDMQRQDDLPPNTITKIDRLARIASEIKTPPPPHQQPVFDPRENIELKKKLIRSGQVTEEQILDAIAEVQGYQRIDFSKLEVTDDLLALAPAGVARQYGVFPVHADAESIHLAMIDPLNPIAKDDLQRLLKRKVVPRLAPEAVIRFAIQKHYKA